MGWAVCTPTVIYNAFRLQKRAKKSHKDYSCAASAAATASLSTAASTHAPAETQHTQSTHSLSRSLSTDDSSSENNSSVFTQDEDMQYQLDLMEQRDRDRDREHRCPCGCPGQNFHDERDAIRMRTKEILGRNGAHFETTDRAFGFEVLRHQGRHYCPEDIAPVWKKDCRTWLWKSNEKSKRIQLGDKDRRTS